MVDLILTHDIGGGVTTLQWTVPGESGAAAVRFDTLRSADPGDFTTAGTCLESDDSADTLSLDGSTPPPDSAWYYLIRVENGCPAATGEMGTSSDGSPRVGASCP